MADEPATQALTDLITAQLSACGDTDELAERIKGIVKDVLMAMKPFAVSCVAAYEIDDVLASETRYSYTWTGSCMTALGLANHAVECVRSEIWGDSDDE